jgi:hypothetical protein
MGEWGWRTNDESNDAGAKPELADADQEQDHDQEHELEIFSNFAEHNNNGNRSLSQNRGRPLTSTGGCIWMARKSLSNETWAALKNSRQFRRAIRRFDLAQEQPGRSHLL